MIIDHQDDLGAFFRQSAPELANSTLVKEASWQEKPEMLDRQFAVILVEPNGTEHRKLAMHDAGNTLASVTYLLTRDHELSDSAVKLAAYNLLNSAMHYGLYEEFGDNLLRHEKLGSAFDVLAVLADSLNGDDIIDERRVGVKIATSGAASYVAGGQRALGANPTVQVSGQPQMAGQASGQMMGAGAKAVAPNTVAKYASYDLIKEAQFMWPDLDPVDRRAFSLIIKEAALLEGADVPDSIYQYSGNELNPSFESIMKRRQSYTANEELQEDYERLGKVAHVMGLPDATEALYLLDEQAGLLDRYNTSLPDPVLSVYGTSKEASWSWNHGGEYCTEGQLQLLCTDPVKRSQFESLFGEELCSVFKKDPVKFFESRPVEQQVIISRMASSTSM